MTKSPPKSHPLHIFVVSGGTGRTAALVVNSALAQFRSPSVCVTNQPQVRTAAKLRSLIRDAKKKCAVVCHTLVEPKLRKIAVQEAKLCMVPLVDILGPVITLLADHLQVDPLNQPGLSYEVNKERFDRMDAVDFTLAHDDGQRVGSLHKADVVLVGVSRVSKSVTCFFLAYQGIRAANVALTCTTEPPAELLKLDPAKVVALTMNPHRLRAIRNVRGQKWHGAMQEYADEHKIREEMHYVNSLVTAHRWRYIDVSYKAVEEVADEIAKMIISPSDWSDKKSAKTPNELE